MAPSTLFDTAIELLGVHSEAVDVPAPSEAADASGRSLATIAGARVLLVEDNALNREVATELLAEAGLVVDVAEDGEQAIARLRESAYDAVLMDMQMPVMDGLEATGIIRTMPGLATLPVIAMTANAMEADRKRCLDAGMNDHIGKPIDPRQLWATLLAWIAPRGEAMTSPKPARGASTALPPELLSVPGLDARIGLDRFLGKAPSYIGLLRRFTASQCATEGALDAALAVHDTPQARRLAHTLKGLAATIGALPLRDAAAALELALDKELPAEELAAAREPAMVALRRLLEHLAAALPPDLASEPATAVEPGALRDACKALEAAFTEGSFESQALLQRHGPVLRAAFGARAEQIIACATRFDFDAALQALAEARAEAG